MLPWLQRLIRVALVVKGKSARIDAAAHSDRDADLTLRDGVDESPSAPPLTDFSTLDELTRIIYEPTKSSPDHHGKP